MRVRVGGIEDAEPIRAIYNLEVETSTATMDLVPRSLAEQREWLAARSGAWTTLVAVDDGVEGLRAGVGLASEAPGSGPLIGFASLSPYKDRPAYRTTVENSIYVHRDWQGRRVGSTLLRELLHIARATGFHAVMARVEATRQASIALHQSLGYELVGIEREVGRKFNRWHDMALLQRMLDGPLASPLPGDR